MAWPITTQIGYEYARSQKWPDPYLNGSGCGLLTCRRRLFSGQDDVPGTFRTCNSPAEVFLRAAGGFFSAKNAFPAFLWHVIALLKSSYVPQAFFFGRSDVPGFLKTCNSPVEVFLRAAGPFFSAKMTLLGFLGHVIALLRSSYVPQAFIFRQKWRSWISKTCTSPVEVFLRAAGAFFSAKIAFLGFFGHVIALLRSSYVPQALFFLAKMTFLGFQDM